MKDLKEEMFAILWRAGALAEFRDVAESWIRATAVEMTGAADDSYLHALRGQMRICIELAEGASAALAAREAEAKAERADGIRGTIG